MATDARRQAPEALLRSLLLESLGGFQGGEFGATRVRNHDGRMLVLKVIGGPELLADVTEGVRLAGNLRRRGYPAPEYLGLGLEADVVWTLQELLPGEVPGVMTERHAEQLLELAERHAEAAGSERDWVPIALAQITKWAAVAGANSVTKSLALELETAARNASLVPRVRTGDVMHSDFHHRNFLADGERVTGVFDWELSSVGDWRFDVVTLGFWCTIHRDRLPEATAAVVLDRLGEVCEPEALAFFAAIQSLRHLVFDLTVRPERLERVAAGIENAIAPWWRTAL